VISARLSVIALSGFGATVSLEDGSKQIGLFLNNPALATNCTIHLNSTMNPPIATIQVGSTNEFMLVCATPNTPNAQVSLWINGTWVASVPSFIPTSPRTLYRFGDTAGTTGHNGNIDWDYVRFYNGPPPSPVGQSDSGAATLSLVFGGTHEFTGAGPGPFTVPPPSLSGGGAFAFGIFGPPNAAAALFLGAPSTGAASFGCSGSLDLLPLVPPIAFVLPAGRGVLYQSFGVLPPLAPGVLVLQAAVLQPGSPSCPVVLSSAKIL
jgi:hypothetical protein